MEQYLNKCLDSLLIESDMNLLEVIVVNDGSKDKSSEIAHAYETRFPETFRVIDKENGNYGSCINRALKECKGKYIKVLDADDYYDTKEFEKLVDFLKTTDVDVVFTPYRKVTFDGDIIQEVLLPEKYCYNIYQVDNFFINHKLPYFRCHHAMCHKTSLWIKNKYVQTESISYSDLEYVFYTFLYADTMQFCNANIYRYCIGRDDQTVNQANVNKNIVHFGYIAKRMLLEIERVYKNISDERVENMLRTSSFCLRTFLDETYSKLIFDNEKKQLVKDIAAVIDRIPYFKRMLFTGSWKYKLCIEHNFSPKLFLAAQKIVNILRQ